MREKVESIHLLFAVCWTGVQHTTITSTSWTTISRLSVWLKTITRLTNISDRIPVEKGAMYLYRKVLLHSAVINSKDLFGTLLYMYISKNGDSWKHQEKKYTKKNDNENSYRNSKNYIDRDRSEKKCSFSSQRNGNVCVCEWYSEFHLPQHAHIYIYMHITHNIGQQSFSSDNFKAIDSHFPPKEYTLLLSSKEKWSIGCSLRRSRDNNHNHNHNNNTGAPTKQDCCQKEKRPIWCRKTKRRRRLIDVEWTRRCVAFLDTQRDKKNPRTRTHTVF